MNLLRAILLIAGVLTSAAAPLELPIERSKTNGVNKGQLTRGGMVDLTARHRELAPPIHRLHG